MSYAVRKKVTEMNVVMIIPTGIGCEIGGHCGDGNPPARLLGACCDNLVLHPDVVNKADYQPIDAGSAARTTIGLDAEILELRAPLRLIARIENRVAVGDGIGWRGFVAQLKDLQFDALGIAVEIITEDFIHCLLKGSHKAPRLSTSYGLSNRDVDCMVSPYGCFGAPHQACLDAGTPVIVVRENKSCLEHPEHPRVHLCGELPRSGRDAHGDEGRRPSRDGTPAVGPHGCAEGVSVVSASWEALHA